MKCFFRKFKARVSLLIVLCSLIALLTLSQTFRHISEYKTRTKRDVYQVQPLDIKPNMENKIKPLYNVQPVFKAKEKFLKVRGGEENAGYQPLHVPVFKRGLKTMKAVEDKKLRKQKAIEAEKEKMQARINVRKHRQVFIKSKTVRDHGANFFPIHRGPIATKGYPWPYPRNFTSDKTKRFTVDVQRLEFNAPSSCSILQKAIMRAKGVLRHLSKKWKVHKDMQQMTQVDISIQPNCSDNDYPSQRMDESYALEVEEGKVHLKAREVWGGLHALETLLQLLYTADDIVYINATVIEDSPRFLHRAVHVDTARHFISLDKLKENLDAMAMNKFNVLHWHIVDDQSFPFVSRAFPELSRQGAYHPTQVYTPENVTEIIDYARDRGIRVMPEFDTPGHTFSWGLSHPELLSGCNHEHETGPIDPTKPQNFAFLSSFFRDVRQSFKDDLIHMGGDEVPFTCWSRNEAIKQFMKKKNMQGFDKLVRYYFANLFSVLQPLRNTSYVFWQEVFDHGVQLPKDSIIMTWKGNEANEILSLVSKGYKVVTSACWYLNYLENTKFGAYYMCDPQEAAMLRMNLPIRNRPNARPDPKHAAPHNKVQLDKLQNNVIGGSACMWAEFVDDDNLIQNLWPHASAVGERLWSPRSMKDLRWAEERVEEQYCRMKRRGIHARPILGPSSCDVTDNYNKLPRTSMVKVH